MNVKIFLIIILGFVIVSCSTRPKMVASHNSSSELLGAAKTRVSAGFNQGYDILFTDSVQNDSLTPVQELQDSLSFNFNLFRNLMPMLDFESRFGINVPLYLGFKFTPYSSGPFSSAIRFGSSIYVASAIATAFNGTERTYLTNGYQLPLELLFGYRFADFYLLYVGYGMDRFSYILEFLEADIDQDIQLSGYHNYFILGNEFKFDPVVVSLVFSLDDYEIEERRSADVSDFNISIHGGYSF